MGHGFVFFVDGQVHKCKTPHTAPILGKRACAATCGYLCQNRNIHSSISEPFLVPEVEKENITAFGKSKSLSLERKTSQAVSCLAMLAGVCIWYFCCWAASVHGVVKGRMSGLVAGRFFLPPKHVANSILMGGTTSQSTEEG